MPSALPDRAYTDVDAARAIDAALDGLLHAIDDNAPLLAFIQDPALEWSDATWEERGAHVGVEPLVMFRVALQDVLTTARQLLREIQDVVATLNDARRGWAQPVLTATAAKATDSSSQSTPPGGDDE